METPWDERLYSHLIGFFEQSVLTSYLVAPDKFTITTDNFEGRVAVTDANAGEMIQAGKRDYIDVHFGYRTLCNGDLAIAAYLPDLVERSPAHVDRWRGFHLEHPDWLTESDDRFDQWVRRYLEASWEVDNVSTNMFSGS